MNIFQSIHTFDVQTFYWLMARKHRVILTRIGRAISFTANGPLYIVFALISWLAGNQTLVLVLAFGFLFERSVYFVLKNGFKRNRPADTLEDFKSFIIPSDQFSFPSGHTSGAFFIAFCVSEWFPSVNIMLYFWAINVGLSRIFLGVHFPTDTVVGALLGTTCAALIIGAFV